MNWQKVTVEHFHHSESNLFTQKRVRTHLMAFYRTACKSWHQKGGTVLDLNEARDDAVAVALAVLYANHLYLTPCVNHVSTSSLNFSQTGCYTWCLTVSKLLEGRLRSRQNYTNSALAGNFFCKDYKRQTANNLIEIWQIDIRTLL